MGELRRNDLGMERRAVAPLGRYAVEISRNCLCFKALGQKIDISISIERACAAKRSIAPDDPFPTSKAEPLEETWVQVVNVTTLQAVEQKFLGPFRDAFI